MNSALNYIINMQEGTFGKGINQAQHLVGKLDEMIKEVGATFAGLFVLDKAKELMEETTKISAQFEDLDNVIKFTSGSQQSYAENTEFVNKTVEDLKIPIMEAMDSFGQFSGALKDTEFAGEGARKMFLGIETAAKVMKLGPESVNSMATALQRIAQHGSVDMRAFRILRSALPESLKVMSKQLHMTMAQVEDAVKNGTIKAASFLPGFANQLMETFGPGVQNAVNSTTSKLNEHANAIVLMKRALGEDLMPVQLMWMDLEMKGIEIIRWSIGFYDRHSDAINTLAVALGAAALGYWAVIGASKVFLFVTGLLKLATVLYTEYTWALAGGETALTAAQWALNVAMKANPIGVTIMLIAGAVAVIAGLAVGIWYAYKHFETFRAVVDGIIETFKDFLKMIKDVGVAIFDLATGNWSGFKSHVKDALGEALGVYTGKSFAKGYTDSLAASAKAALAAIQVHNLDDFNKKYGTHYTFDEMHKNAIATSKMADKFSTDPTKNPPGSPEGAGKESAHGGNSVKNITVTIGKVTGIEHMTSANMNNLDKTDFAKIVTDLIVAQVHDAEVVIANN